MRCCTIGPVQEDIPSLEEAIGDVLCHLTPALFQAYEQEAQKFRKALAEEQKHFEGARRYLKARQAPQQEFDNLRVQREAEIRRLKDQFSANVRGLLNQFGCFDC